MTENVNSGVMPAMMACGECGSKVVVDRIQDGLCADCRGVSDTREYRNQH